MIPTLTIIRDQQLDHCSKKPTLRLFSLPKTTRITRGYGPYGQTARPTPISITFGELRSDCGLRSHFGLQKIVKIRDLGDAWIKDELLKQEPMGRSYISPHSLSNPPPRHTYLLSKIDFRHLCISRVPNIDTDKLIDLGEDVSLDFECLFFAERRCLFDPLHLKIMKHLIKPR